MIAIRENGSSGNFNIPLIQNSNDKAVEEEEFDFALPSQLRLRPNFRPMLIWSPKPMIRTISTPSGSAP
jgi:hypothetical protein